MPPSGSTSTSGCLFSVRILRKGFRFTGGDSWSATGSTDGTLDLAGPVNDPPEPVRRRHDGPLAASPPRQSLDHLARHVGDLEAAIDLCAHGGNRTAGGEGRRRGTGLGRARVQAATRSPARSPRNSRSGPIGQCQKFSRTAITLHVTRRLDSHHAHGRHERQGRHPSVRAAVRHKAGEANVDRPESVSRLPGSEQVAGMLTIERCSDLVGRGFCKRPALADARPRSDICVSKMHTLCNN